MGMLEKDAAKRIPSAKALTRELQRVEDRLSNQHDPQTMAKKDEGEKPMEKTPSSSDSDRIAWKRLLAAGALLATLLVLLYAIQRPPSPEKRLRRANDLVTVGGRENDARAAEQLNALISEHPQNPQAAKAASLVSG